MKPSKRYTLISLFDYLFAKVAWRICKSEFSGIKIGDCPYFLRFKSDFHRGQERIEEQNLYAS
ncbi:unnamed protein product, partial [marine sediment metagenome]